MSFSHFQPLPRVPRMSSTAPMAAVSQPSGTVMGVQTVLTALMSPPPAVSTTALLPSPYCALAWAWALAWACARARACAVADVSVVCAFVSGVVSQSVRPPIACHIPPYRHPPVSSDQHSLSSFLSRVSSSFCPRVITQPPVILCFYRSP
jgi:hypothetical protein